MLSVPERGLGGKGSGVPFRGYINAVPTTLVQLVALALVEAVVRLVFYC